MIDHAALNIDSGKEIAAEFVKTVNDNTLTCHYHDFYELFYLHKGERFVTINSSTFLLKEHDFIIMPPYSMHSSCSQDNVTFGRTVVYFRREVVPPEIAELICNNEQPWSITDDEKRAEHEALVLAMSTESENNLQFSDLLMESQLRQLLISSLRYHDDNPKVVYEPKLAAVVRFIQENYGQKLDLQLLADKFYVSKFYLCRIFKRFTNSSVVEYINKTRILHAKRLFAESDLSITDIAEAVGFASLTHFERTYLKITGETPKKTSMKVRQFRSQGAKVRDTTLEISNN